MDSDPGIETLLEELNGPDANASWSAFLTAYADLIYGVICNIAHDDDHSGDCFLYVCEKLAEKSYRRLRAFSPNGRARFTSWLRAVVRNLSLDWYRSQFGRQRISRSVRSLTAVDQEIFRAVFQRHLPAIQVWQELSSNGLELSFSEVEEKVNQIRARLSSRQLWLLSTSRNPSLECGTVEGELTTEQMADCSPSPEETAVLEDSYQKLKLALRGLKESDRLLLRLRFEQELGLREIATLVGLKDAQTADRRIKDAISQLRLQLGFQRTLSGKQKSASV